MALLTYTTTQKYYKYQGKNIVVCKCAKYQGNPANISKGIPTFDV